MFSHSLSFSSPMSSFNYSRLNNPQPYSGQYYQNQPHLRNPTPTPPFPQNYAHQCPAPPAYYGHPQPYPPPPRSASNYGQYQVPESWSGTVAPPEVMRLFQVADRDRSGYLDEHELRQALLSLSPTFGLRTLRLLMFLYSDNLNDSNPPRMGFRQFSALMTCLYQWQATFNRLDRNRNGGMEACDLSEALASLDCAVSPSVLQLLVSKYLPGGSFRAGLTFDNFVECGMIVKGLTDKFKEKDSAYTGSATWSYDAFLSAVLPYLAPST